MKFTELSLSDAWLIEPDKHEDKRGFFARGKCAREFEQHGIPTEFLQTNLSHNSFGGTFRGLHYQVPPSREGKLVRCVAGSVLDIIVDLRPNSGTFLKNEAVRLDAEKMAAVFVPTGFAHGFLTLDDNSLLVYEMSDFYSPELGRGIRWSDPALEIKLPEDIKHIHSRDATYSDIDTVELNCFLEP